MKHDDAKQHREQYDRDVVGQLQEGSTRTNMIETSINKQLEHDALKFYA